MMTPTIRSTAVGLLVAGMLAVGGTAIGQEQGEWRFGARLIHISTDAESEPLFDTGSQIALDSSTSLEFDTTYQLGENWGMEWMITAAPHDTTVVGGTYNGLDLGSVWIGQTTFTLHYLVPLRGRWRPYLGGGVGLGYFLYSDTTSAAEAIGVDDLKSDLAWGPVGQLGLIHRLNQAWILSLDVKWVGLPFDVELRGPSGTIDEVTLDMNPVIIGLGAALRF